MGAAPARLRAKGYGATVSLPASQRAKLKLRSERRTGLHPIGEVRTRYGLEFDAGAAALDADARKLLADVAALCKEKPRLRLSVEGHADARGDATDNARVAAARAAACCEHLKTLGVATTRLVAHGFGAALPVGDNATDAGRRANRRVNFLLIPDVSHAVS